MVGRNAVVIVIRDAEPDVFQCFLALIGQQQVCDDGLIAACKTVISRKNQIKRVRVGTGEYKGSTVCDGGNVRTGQAGDCQRALDRAYVPVIIKLPDDVKEIDFVPGLKVTDLWGFIPSVQDILCRSVRAALDHNLHAQGMRAGVGDLHSGKVIHQVVLFMPFRNHTGADKGNSGAGDARCCCGAFHVIIERPGVRLRTIRKAG